MSYFESVEFSLDTNDLDAETLPVESKGTTVLNFFILGDEGSHNTHKVMLQVRPIITGDWVDAQELTGVGCVGGIQLIAMQARLKVTKAESSESTVKGYIRGA